MLTALQETLQVQQRQQYDADRQFTNQMSKPASFQPSFNAPTQQWTYLDPMLDEESTEADDVGAFSSLLSGPSSESECVDGLEPQSPEAEFSQPPPALPEDSSEQASDSEKSIMVCRHWKTKGWCRMEGNCKFLHPEHKRGIAAVKCCIGGSTNDGDMSKAACPGMSTTGSLPGDALSATTLSRRKKRGGKNRSNKANQTNLPGLDHKETTITVLPEYMGGTYFCSSFQCPQFV
jgi:hypothetical protein